MVSLSYKSLESYILEDNLSGLQSFLASRSVVIDDRDDNGATALILAASKGKPEFCNELILHGADVNTEDNVSYLLSYIVGISDIKSLLQMVALSVFLISIPRL